MNEFYCLIVPFLAFCFYDFLLLAMIDGATANSFGFQSWPAPLLNVPMLFSTFHLASEAIDSPFAVRLARFVHRSAVRCLYWSAFRFLNRSAVLLPCLSVVIAILSAGRMFADGTMIL